MAGTAFEPAGSQLKLWSSETEAEGWHLRESRRARRLSVRISRTGRVEVVVPTRTSRRTVEAFLREHRDWIERHREAARRRAVPAQPFPPRRIELAACGETLQVHLAGGTGRARIRQLAPDMLGITGDTSNVSAVRTLLQRWLVRKATKVLAPQLATLARELDMKYTRVTIRRQRTRWGSCSSRGTISLNCSLLFQPPAVVRYLLVHELAHTVHMNHSKQFWQAVAAHCPDHRSLDRQLLEGWRRVPGWAVDP